MDLEEIRDAIDTIDYEIVSLLSRRMECALRLKKLKTDIVQTDRERQVIEHVRTYSRNLLQPDFTERLYAVIIGESRRVQQESPTLIGFQGEHGAYSEMAAQIFGPEAATIPCEGFQDVFKGVEAGQLDFGIVPVENSLEGAVTEVSDLLAETGLHIVGEVKTAIHHCLLTLPGIDHRTLRAVYSHPQALAQCRGFIARSRLEARPFYDTAGAARMLREERPAASAVVASRLCADLYNLEIVAEDIEDHASNATRFVVLAREACEQGGDKCSLVFTLPHRAGELFAILKLFSDRQINITRIESRPLRKDPGAYTFFLDFEGSDRDQRVSEALDAAGERATTFRLLGCYPAASEKFQIPSSKESWVEQV
jgi:prephenate dehydratase/chorismate mutase/prephenate dehydratase